MFRFDIFKKQQQYGNINSNQLQNLNVNLEKKFLFLLNNCNRWIQFESFEQF